MQEYFSLLTATGANLLINAVANKTPVKLGKIAVSDSEIAPSEAATALENTKHEFAINSLTQDPQNSSILNVEGVIPSNVGGFNIRKFAIFTQSGEMFAVGRVPLSYKPALDQGAGSDVVFKIRILIGNVSNIELKVDNSVVLATRDWAEKTFLKLTDKIDAYTKTQSDGRYLKSESASGFMQTRNLDTQNLNDFLTCGSFQQGALGNARLDLNYPVAAYGTLEVFPTGQRYVVYETNETYQRTLVSAPNKPWGAWEKVAAPIEKLPFLGVNQTRRDVTDQRRVGEIYTNDTGRAIFVAIQVHILPSSGSTLEASLEVGGVAVSSARHGTTAGFLNYTLTAIILPNEQYTLRLGGSAKILKWFELR